MQIERAREMGFCFGVRRAIKLLEQAAQEHGTVESVGAVVHNRLVVSHLAELGVKIVESIDQIKGRVVAIPSHGLGLVLLDKLQADSLTVVDATCPFVRRAQKAVHKMAQDGFQIVVFGDADHAEVKGVLGWCAGRGVAANSANIAFLEPPRRLGILSQTTQSPERFDRFVRQMLGKFLSRVNEMRIINTICDATRERQAAALELASRSDIMLVVGDRHSANTRRLTELCTGTGVETHLVEGAHQLDAIWLKGKGRVGVTAGASTPDETIEQVMNQLQNLS